MKISRRVEEVRQSVTHGNKQSSAQAQSPKTSIQATEPHNMRNGQYLGEWVYGGLDGIITTFAVVSGVAGAELGSSVILILGVANLLADGFSMGTGAYLSAKSEQEYYAREWQREAREVEEYPDQKRAELQTLYQAQGYTHQETMQLVKIQSREQGRWTKTMLVEEKGMLADGHNPWLSAGATFLAFLVAGSLPLLIYLVGLFVPIAPTMAFGISILLSGLALFGLGAAKVLVTGLNPFRSGAEMLVIGGLAAGVAYLVGALLKGIGG